MTDPMKVFASCVRGHLVSAPGKNLLALDFAGIESRVVAWLAGEEWKLKAFRAYDAGTGPDTYKLAYSDTFQVSVASVTPDQRQVGKVIDLSIDNYQGGVGAFVTMTKTYGVNLEKLADAFYHKIPADIREQSEWFMEKGGSKGLPARIFVTCDSIKRIRRLKIPNIVRLWEDMEKAAIYATSNPGKVYWIPSKKIGFMVKGAWLYMRLPSNRRIAYYKPEIHRNQVEDENGDLVDGTNEHLTYMGTDTYTRRWMRVSTYGGRLVQNAGEGVPRDLLCNGMLAAEEAGYETIMTVHDEAVFEIDERFGSLDEAKLIICSVPLWAEGLPVAAAGWRGQRCRK
jgi:DNA polymerase